LYERNTAKKKQTEKERAANSLSLECIAYLLIFYMLIMYT